MNRPLFEGKLIRLVALEPERDAEKIASWGKDSDYQRLQVISPAVRYSTRLVRSWYEKEGHQGHAFMIQTLADGQMIGFLELDGFDWAAGTAWVGIGIGEREYQGKGYGTDAMKVLLFYAFSELNLHRVNLNVFSYNHRAIRSYEKAGYRYEGTQRERILREDQRWDVLDMGILRSDWEQTREREESEAQTAAVAPA